MNDERENPLALLTLAEHQSGKYVTAIEFFDIQYEGKTFLYHIMQTPGHSEAFSLWCLLVALPR